MPAGFALYMRRFPDAPAARPFSRLMGMTALWALCHALSFSTVSLPLRLFWLHLQIIPLAFMPLMILMLALEYTGREQWLTRRRWGWLLYIPLLTILIEWTSAYHTLYRYNFVLDVSGPAPVLFSSKGVWYWVYIAYTYALSLSACGVLLTAFPVQTPYFGNALVISLGIVLPFAVDLLYMLGITPIQGYSFTPLTFILTGALQLWAILRFRLFDLIPVARQTMLEQMREGMVVLDAQQRIVDVNPAAAQILGASRAQLIGQTFAPQTHFPDWQIGVPAAGSIPAEQLLELSTGQSWYQVSRSSLTDRRGGRPGQLIVFRDITELKQAQLQFIEQQRALAMTEERMRLARELHDGLGQTLGYVKMRSQVARELLAQGEVAEAEQYLANLSAVAHEAHTDIREYLLGVKATSAAEPAFLHALQQYLRQFGQNYGIRAELHVAPEAQCCALTPTAEVQLLRIVQEALTNVRKYAQAARVQVSLSVEADELRICIQDDGQGFDPAAPAASGPTFGLGFMQDRAAELRGRLEVHSAPGQGTRVNVIVPLGA